MAAEPTFKEINNDLKNKTFKSVYLFYGEESYLKNLYKKRVKDIVISNDDTMNYAYFTEDEIDENEIIGLCDTMPFFADKRLIIVENSSFFKNAAPQISDYIQNIPDSTCLLFVERDVDKRGKMFKNVKKFGLDVEFRQQDEKTLNNWVLTTLKKENIKISKNTLDLFFEKTGYDMENIDMELEKLICYCYGKNFIESQDVEQICTLQITGKIFEMINAVVSKQTKKALDMYYDLLSLKEPPMRIIFLITRQFNIMLKVKSMVNSKKSKSEIASSCKIPPFVAGKYMTQVSQFTTDGLKEIVTKCIEAEENVKTGLINDKLSVELLLSEFCR